MAEGLPVTPADLARDAAAVRQAGALAVHVHVRDADRCESLAPVAVTRVPAAIRERCRGFPVGLSTGAWVVPDPEERLRVIASWTTLPEFVSVDFDEAGAEAVAAELLDRGVGIEAGLDGVAAAEVCRLPGCGALPACVA